MGIISAIRKTFAKLYGGEHLIKYLRSRGVKIGENCRIFSDISTSESYLIEICDNTTVSGNVTFITHDASIQKVMSGVTDVFGKIKIGKNCFIGNGATIMYGVTLADNTIFAADAVVTKSFNESGKIIGGNPAKVISDFDEFADKACKYAVNIKGLTPEEKKALLQNDEILVKK